MMMMMMMTKSDAEMHRDDDARIDAGDFSVNVSSRWSTQYRMNTIYSQQMMKDDES